MKFWPFLILILTGCNFNEVQTDINEPTTGYQPIYASSSASEIKLLPPQQIREPGKIYIYDPYLLVNEKNRGIHIFDNTNPSNPKPVAYAEILGNSDLAIKNDVLYADHIGNLVALKLNNFQSLEQIGSLPINQWLMGVPPPPESYFECIEKSKGIVVAWKLTEIQNKNCYASSRGW